MIGFAVGVVFVLLCFAIFFLFGALVEQRLQVKRLREVNTTLLQQNDYFKDIANNAQEREKAFLAKQVIVHFQPAAVQDLATAIAKAIAALEVPPGSRVC
jgi:hypothetical protein